PGISGQRGHDATWAVAQVLVRGFALRIDEARPLLEEYSQRCQPPWSDKELEHKLRSAQETSRLRAGYLLDSANGRAGHSRAGKGGWSARGESPEPIHLTDMGNAQRLAQHHGADLRHCHPWRKWLAWGGHHWQEDATAEATRRTKRMVASLFRWAADRTT